jgi:hypothetical protein
MKALAPRETHVGEKTGDQEEGRHAENVNGEEQHGECRAAMTVSDDPDRSRRGNKRDCRVEHDPEQQGEPSDRVQSVQPGAGALSPNSAIVDSYVVLRLYNKFII